MADQTGPASGQSAESERAPPSGAVSRPIAALLLALVAIVFLPLLAFSVVLIQSSNKSQTAALNTFAEAATNSVAESVEREITGMLTTLRVLSTSPSLRDGRISELYTWARSSLAASGSYLILLDSDLNQVFNTRVALGEQTGKTSDPASTLLALERNRPVVSDVFFGKTAGTWVFNVTIPVVEEGQPRALILTQNAENLQRTLVERNSEGGWKTALVDRVGNVVASTTPDAAVGKPFFIRLNLSERSGLNHFWTQGSRPYEVIMSPSPSSGWWVVSWISAHDAAGATRRSYFYLLLGGAVVAVLAIGAATLLGRQIARSVRHLAVEARRLGTGASVAGRDYAVQELTVVSHALAEASRKRQASENEIRFLMREVAHRSKNQLTVVSSIAKQSGRGASDFSDFQESFQKRIQGLARSTDLLIAGGVAGVEMHDLVVAQLEPFRPDSPGRLVIEGPTFRLSHQSAQTLGMALHELATNAAKYGAFAGTSGRILIGWSLGADDRLLFGWREHAVLAESLPERKGFGTEVIERMVGRGLEADVERILHGDGIEWRFSIPLAALVAQIDVDEPQGG